MSLSELDRSGVFSDTESDRLKAAFQTDQQKFFESQKKAVAAPTTSAGVELSRIAQLILQIDSRSFSEDAQKEAEAKATGRTRLAASLGCTTSDLQEIVESYGEKWQELVLEERVKQGIDSTTFRDISWDRLEAAVLRKLLVLVDGNHTNTVAELLAIARTANQATRGERVKPNQPGGGQNLQANIFLPGAPQEGVLPAGHLGKISLNLSSRVIKQIEGTVVTPSNENRQIDSLEMLTIDQIQQVGQESEKSE